MTFYAVFRPKISCGQVDMTYFKATDVTASCGWLYVCAGGWVDGEIDGYGVDGLMDTSRRVPIQLRRINVHLTVSKCTGSKLII